MGPCAQDTEVVEILTIAPVHQANILDPNASTQFAMGLRAMTMACATREEFVQDMTHANAMMATQATNVNSRFAMEN